MTALGYQRIDLNTADLMRPHSHGEHEKTLVVLHETISSDLPGLADIAAVEADLAKRDYGIHGMTDAEGLLAWAYGLGDAIFYHAGGVNTESIGIEQVSDIPKRYTSTEARKLAWRERQKQLRATAKLLAAIHMTHPKVPLRYSDSRTPGITTHWDVSRFHRASDGHTDCFPVHKGGYFPVLQVVNLARAYFDVANT